MLTCITPTGARPEAFARLTAAVNAQTLPEFEWIVVDDCDPPTPAPAVRDGIRLTYVRPSWRWEPGQNTQAACLLEALAWCDLDARVVVLEDDDCYAPHWLEACAASTADLFGHRDSYYYNIATRRYRHIVHPSNGHCSLSGTAMSPRAVYRLAEVCAHHTTRLDIELWRCDGLTKGRYSTARPAVIGIKGLPGRPGIGIGHRQTFGEADVDGRVWGEWMPQS